MCFKVILCFMGACCLGAPNQIQFSIIMRETRKYFSFELEKVLVVQYTTILLLRQDCSVSSLILVDFVSRRALGASFL